MKILHALFTLATAGGTETLLIDIMNRQSRKASVTLIVVSDKVNHELLETIDKRVEVILLNKKENSKIALIKTFIRINRIVNQLQPDIIHCHDPHLIPLFFRWKAKTVYTPHVLTIPTTYLKHYRKIFAISGAVQQDIKERAGLNNVELIYNGTDLSAYRRKNSYAFDPETEIFQIIQLGRLSWKKGQKTAVEALAAFIKQHPLIKIRLDMVGEGEDKDELQALIGTLHLEDYIRLIGRKDRRWIEKHLKDYHLLIQPSVTEGFGISVIEGFAAGLPVVMSNNGGLSEIKNLIGAGILFEVNKAEELSNQMYAVYTAYSTGKIQDSEAMLKDRKKLEPFDIERTVELYFEQYQSILPTV